MNTPQLPLSLRTPPDQQFDAFHGQPAVRADGDVAAGAQVTPAPGDRPVE